MNKKDIKKEKRAFKFWNNLYALDIFSLLFIIIVSALMISDNALFLIIISISLTIGLIWGIHNLRRRNKELLQSQKEIQELHEKFYSLFENLPVGVYRSTAEGKVLSANTAMYKMYGYNSMAEYIKNPSQKNYINSKQREDFIKKLEEDGFINNMEFQLFKEDGSEFWVSSQVKASFDENGKMKYFDGIDIDITEKKRIENTLKGFIESSSSNYGNEFFDSITLEIARVLDVDYVEIGRLKEDDNNYIETVSLCHKDKIIDNFEYSLKDTPCDNVVGKTLCCYPANTAKLFPKDILLEEMKIEGYVGIPLFDSQKKPLGIIVALSTKPIDNEKFAKFVIKLYADRTATEIERKLYEDALFRSEKNLRLITENAPDFIIKINKNAEITYVSRAIPGLSIDNMLGTKLEKWIASDYKKLCRDTLHKAWETGQLQCFEARGATSDKWWSNKINPIIEDGVIEGAVYISREVTQQKEAENALIESEEKFRNIAERSFDLIIMTDLKGVITYTSPSVEINFDYKADEMINLNIKDLVNEDEQPDIVKALEAIGKGNTVENLHIHLNRKDGAEAILEINACPIYKDNEIIGSQSIARDITETMRLQELESRAQRLETAGQIAGQVAHDFNNLLAPLMAYPEFIRNELEQDHPALEYLEDIESSARQIAEINQQLLTLGRRGHYNQEPINLNKIIKQTVRHLSSCPKSLIIETKLADKLMNIKGGAAQIHRVITNLLLNARDSMQDKGHIIVQTENYYADKESVKYAKVPMGEYVKLTITDNGCGIPDEIKSNIFDPFFSTKTTDKKRGSGLGLSVVNAVVNDHDGFLDVKSELGEGTSFYLYFPITREIPSSTSADKIIGGSEKILVIDDDAVQRDVSRKLLGKLGYTVSVVNSGEEAVEYLYDKPHDLIILDMIMPPGIDGAETYSRILNKYPTQKAIIVSGFAESERVNTALALGAGAFIKKPLTLKSLANAIRCELDRKAVTFS